MGLKVVFSGRTAAGKTTHARLLAATYDVPVYSASSYLRALALGSATGTRWRVRWTPEIDARRTTEIDDEVDAYMVNAVRGAPGGMFDGCFLPWLMKDPETVNLWIESDLPSRVRKCVVSHLAEEELSLTGAREIVEKKDGVSSDRLASVARASFEADERRFHLILDNSSLIPDATLKCAADGIRIFDEVLTDAVAWCSGQLRRKPKSELLVYGRRISF